MNDRLLLIDADPRRSGKLLDGFRERGWISFQVATAQGAQYLFREVRFRLSLIALPLRSGVAGEASAVAGALAQQAALVREEAPWSALGATVHGDEPALMEEAASLGLFVKRIGPNEPPDIDRLLQLAKLDQKPPALPRLIAICPDVDAALTLKQAGRLAGLRVTCVETLAMARESLHGEGAAGLLIDVLKPGSGGVETVRLARQTWPDLVVIAIAGETGTDVGAPSALKAARKLGAHAILPKPLVMSDAAVLLSESFRFRAQPSDPARMRAAS
jgi:CheY-like chemotaxis protein